VRTARGLSDAPSWVVSLDYKLINDLLLYGKYSRGYRQGAVQPFSASGLYEFDPEQVDTYELGFKASFFPPMRGTFNVALNYAYLNTKIQNVTNPTLDPDGLYDIAVPLNAEGDPLPYTTQHKVAANLSYLLPLDPSYGDITIGVGYSYQSDLFISTASNPTFGIVDAYDILNFNVNWKDVLGTPIDLGFFATHALDEKYRAAVTNSWGSFGFENEVPGEPRM